MADSEYSPKFAPFFSFVSVLGCFDSIKYAWKWLADTVLGWYCLCSEYIRDHRAVTPVFVDHPREDDLWGYVVTIQHQSIRAKETNTG